MTFGNVNMKLEEGGGTCLRVVGLKPSGIAVVAASSSCPMGSVVTVARSLKLFPGRRYPLTVPGVLPVNRPSLLLMLLLV